MNIKDTSGSLHDSVKASLGRNKRVSIQIGGPTPTWSRIWIRCHPVSCWDSWHLLFSLRSPCSKRIGADSSFDLAEWVEIVPMQCLVP
ncbi:hypothetical protein VNO78_19922 [Psophocarpus tetragonolobus]|uniref:Uncharacterized protein n=1 Tax=Psophocarpus tetragonolobus TaxID=3891 RepID=A0AAN9XGQ9_PSOTE